MRLPYWKNYTVTHCLCWALMSLSVGKATWPLTFCWLWYNSLVEKTVVSLTLSWSGNVNTWQEQTAVLLNTLLAMLQVTRVFPVEEIVITYKLLIIMISDSPCRTNCSDTHFLLIMLWDLMREIRVPLTNCGHGGRNETIWTKMQWYWHSINCGVRYVQWASEHLVEESCCVLTLCWL